MSARDTHGWLDPAESEGDDAAGSDFLADVSRGKVIEGRHAKRRKVNPSDDDSSDDGDNLDRQVSRQLKVEKSKAAGSPILRYKPPELDKQLGLLEEDDDLSDRVPSHSGDSDIDVGDRTSSSKIQRKLAKSAKTARKSGVVYISRIPPFMKPHTVKHLLSPHAPSGLGRIFLTPETSEARQARLRAGGNKKHNFVDGWVEFSSKREAKHTVEALNTRIIGGKKGGYYYDDVWNLKYLRGFKWRHLTEQIANENAERAARMRVEDRRERKEQKDFLANVERGKMLEGMAKKRAERSEDTGSAGKSLLEIEMDRQQSDQSPHVGTQRDRREFAQRAVKSKHLGERETRQADDVQRVLKKIF